LSHKLPARSILRVSKAWGREYFLKELAPILKLRLKKMGRS